MKKKSIMLSCIAAVAIVAIVGKKTFQSHAFESSNLLMQNVEALTNPDEPYPSERLKCISESANWNMASVCKQSGFESVSCKITGEVTICGVTVKGSYEKGKKYSIAWARYECVQSSGNCCKKQGLFSGDKQLA